MGMNSLDRCSGKIERLAYDYALDFLVLFGCTYRPSFVAAACLIVASKMPIDALSDQGDSFFPAVNASELQRKNDGHHVKVVLSCINERLFKVIEAEDKIPLVEIRAQVIELALRLENEISRRQFEH